jgi:hypothetical protein
MQERAMNTKIPVSNNTAMPIYVGGLMIPPGETRHFEAHQVPAHLRPQPAEAAPEPAPADPLAELVKHKVADVAAALPDLSDEDLARVLELDAADGNARKGVAEAVAAEQLRRAAEQSGGGGA